MPRLVSLLLTIVVAFVPGSSAHGQIEMIKPDSGEAQTKVIPDYWMFVPGETNLVPANTDCTVSADNQKIVCTTTFGGKVEPEVLAEASSYMSRAPMGGSWTSYSTSPKVVFGPQFPDEVLRASGKGNADLAVVLKALADITQSFSIVVKTMATKDDIHLLKQSIEGRIQIIEQELKKGKQ